MKLQKFDRVTRDGSPDGQAYFFYCPGCRELHLFNVGRETRPVWAFSGDMERPTFSPSLLYPTKTPRCHLYLTNGRLQFLNDCGHELSGQTVDLPDIPADYVIGE